MQSNVAEGIPGGRFIGRKNAMRRTGLGFISIFALALVLSRSAAYSASNFSTWQYNRTYTITAPGTGSTVTGFPVMVRLNGKGANGGNATDSIVFATAQSSGWDIRFSNTGTTDSIPFQIQRYDATNKVAIFWVLVPSVAPGSANTTFKMYWGQSGLTGTPSNPAAVFARGASGNGFEAVYHLHEASGASIGDATANANTMTANGGITQSAGVNPNTDSSESFNGTTVIIVLPLAVTKTLILNTYLLFRGGFTPPVQARVLFLVKAVKRMRAEKPACTSELEARRVRKQGFAPTL